MQYHHLLKELSWMRCVYLNSFLFCFFVWFGYGQDKEAKPTAVFRAVFWDRFTSKNLSYVPWGNDSEANCTILDTRVGFSYPSRSLVYYGQSPFKIFSKKLILNESDDIAPDFQLTKVGEFAFKPKENVTQKFLLILLKQQRSQEFKVYPLPVSQNSLPFGSFVCYSQVKEALYLAYGSQKNILNPGKSVKFSYEEIEDIDKSKLRVFTRRNSKYEEAMVDHSRLSRESHAVIFLSAERDRIRLKRYSMKREPVESALGFGSMPLINPPDDSLEDNESTQLMSSPLE